MTATLTPPLVRLDEPQTMDDVARNIDQVIEWAIETENPIGYFAALYKQVTLAVRDAINDGVFDDGERVNRLGVAFSHRYFNSLNAYFHPEKYQGLTLPWEVSFVADRNDNAIMLQHMMAGLNAHITFDLGLAAVAVAGDSLDALEDDFNRINALLCSQIPGMLDICEQLSPELKWIRWLIPDEVGILKRMLTKLRSSAWLFAIYVAQFPDDARQRVAGQAAWTSALGAWYLQPPAELRLLPILVRLIRRREHTNVGDNIRALQGRVQPPVKLNKAYL